MHSSPFLWLCPSESVQRMAGTTPSCLLTSGALLCQLHQLLSPVTQTDSTQQTNSTPNTRESPACTNRALPDAPVTFPTDTKHTMDPTLGKAQPAPVVLNQMHQLLSPLTQSDSTQWSNTQHQGKPSLHLYSFDSCTSYCLHWHRQHIMDQHPTPGKDQPAPVALYQLHQLPPSWTQTDSTPPVVQHPTPGEHKPTPTLIQETSAMLLPSFRATAVRA